MLLLMKLLLELHLLIILLFLLLVNALLFHESFILCSRFLFLLKLVFQKCLLISNSFNFLLLCINFLLQIIRVLGLDTMNMCANYFALIWILSRILLGHVHFTLSVG
jgi:hypothetical protein